MGKPCSRRHDANITRLLEQVTDPEERRRLEDHLLDKSPRSIAKLCKKQRERTQAATVSSS